MKDRPPPFEIDPEIANTYYSIMKSNTRKQGISSQRISVNRKKGHDKSDRPRHAIDGER